jgi:hypothetical protein
MPSGRPPYVKFEERSFEDRAASEKEGRYIAKSVDFVVIRQVGSRDTVECDAKQWLGQIKKDPGFHPDWVEQFDKQYRAYKSGQEITPNGTHVKTWPTISKAQCDMLLNANLRTVEDVAQASESALMNVGIGARELQQKARAWLATAEEHGKGAQELTALRVTTEAQAAQIADLTRLVNELSAKIIKQTGNGGAKAGTDDFLAEEAA